MAQWQFANEYEAEYARSFGGSVAESTLFTQAFLRASAPQATFEGNQLANYLRSLASVLPVFKSMGYRRQVFLLNWGSFDTHTGQKGAGATTQDAQLATLAKALAAFDQANQAAGLNRDELRSLLSEHAARLHEVRLPDPGVLPGQ